ncbi:hypothetical protein [Spirosoma montaniterrae]|uniref:HNH nuclease domain-containing protein n=1 Tax=Spirosoma montaniterrae TaxID=1178516 RepID=A0A1P9X009_9BACT|nr:hypothetical protein [Spirosoma montaniterrae]AQG80925.1 hypothetical protein AWR27_17315 [Spirosoma montaniterrae]
MRRIEKDATALSATMSYKVTGDNTSLRDALCQEQHSICAYTETYLGRSDKKDIEHFNPTLKDKARDNHENWFLVKAQWNSEKASKWHKFQPILHPTATDFERRVIYRDGTYQAASNEDEDAIHLIQLLKLDDPELAYERFCYIENLKENIGLSSKSAQQFIDSLIRSRPTLVYFIRAIEEELGVTVNFDLLKKP